MLKSLGRKFDLIDDKNKKGTGKSEKAIASIGGGKKGGKGNKGKKK